ncbi:MAG: hypothetical protein M1815_005019 [Lichina confinis]|nr:MAG: hypothetical protein M1815_005019 [Lichina confinis]
MMRRKALGGRTKSTVASAACCRRLDVEVDRRRAVCDVERPPRDEVPWDVEADGRSDGHVGADPAWSPRVVLAWLLAFRATGRGGFDHLDGGPRVQYTVLSRADRSTVTLTFTGYESTRLINT